jgi:hypothetical protein
MFLTWKGSFTCKEPRFTVPSDGRKEPRMISPMWPGIEPGTCRLLWITENLPKLLWHQLYVNSNLHLKHLTHVHIICAVNVRNKHIYILGGRDNHYIYIGHRDSLKKDCSETVYYPSWVNDLTDTLKALIPYQLVASSCTTAPVLVKQPRLRARFKNPPNISNAGSARKGHRDIVQPPYWPSYRCCTRTARSRAVGVFWKLEGHLSMSYTQVQWSWIRAQKVNYCSI